MSARERQMAAQANSVWEQEGIGQRRALGKDGGGEEDQRGRRTGGACCLETKHRLAQWCHRDRRGGGRNRLKVVYKGKSKAAAQQDM